MIGCLSYINLCICLSSFKLLFLKSYVSTDFDVHRNWMAITYNLPVKDWYYDTTSEWTLDYPPLFAAFEFFLSLVARFLDIEDALNLTKSSLRTESIIVYQKVTVILSDLVYYYAIYRLCRSLEPFVDSLQDVKKKKDTKSEEVTKSADQSLLDAIYRPDATSCMALLLLFQPGLLLIDHIHFQYNGFLSGILLLSLANIVGGDCAAGSFWFATLLNFKHIYLYCAPAFGLYLLTSYCAAKVDNRYRLLSFISRTFQLGLIVISVTLITFFPYLNLETMKQILSRLFPFERGLTHSYWAPNIWSLYNTADKILATVFKNRLVAKFDLDSITPKTSTSGMAIKYDHLYLPTIEPLISFTLVATFTVPLVIKFLLNVNRTSPVIFLKGLTLAAFTSFMFGWHVHEKAIILVMLPMIPLSLLVPGLRNTFLRLTLAGTYALFPLIFEPAEYLSKLTILLAYYCYARSVPKQKPLNILDKLFVLGIIFVEGYVAFIHGHILQKLEFLPLMMTSCSSAVGITISYLELYYDFIRC